MHDMFDNDDGSITGTRDLTYDLISAIYHSLLEAKSSL